MYIIPLFFAFVDFIRGRGYLPRELTAFLQALAIATYCSYIKQDVTDLSVVYFIGMFLSLWLAYAPGWSKWQNARIYDRVSKEFPPIDIITDWLYDKTHIDWLCCFVGMFLRHSFFALTFIITILYVNLSWYSIIWLPVFMFLSGFAYAITRLLPVSIDPLKVAEPLRAMFLGMCLIGMLYG